MNALSGLDPKYIDEAAFELHDAKLKPGSEKPAKAKITNFRKGLLIALPAAAAAFLLIGVALALPALLKNGATQSASEAAAEAPMEAADAAAEAPENVYDTSGYEAEAEAPMEAAETAAEPEPVQDAASINAAEATEDTGRESAKAAEEAISEEGIGLTEADYHDGLLTVRISGSLPADLRNTDYTITGTAANGSERSIDAGSLDQILVETDPLTLDLSDLKLSAGTYTLTIGEESIEFEIP